MRSSRRRSSTRTFSRSSRCRPPNTSSGCPPFFRERRISQWFPVTRGSFSPARGCHDPFAIGVIILFTRRAVGRTRQAFVLHPKPCEVTANARTALETPLLYLPSPSSGYSVLVLTTIPAQVRQTYVVPQPHLHLSSFCTPSFPPASILSAGSVLNNYTGAPLCPRRWWKMYLG